MKVVGSAALVGRKEGRKELPSNSVETKTLEPRKDSTMFRFSMLSLIAFCGFAPSTNAVVVNLNSVGWDDPPGFFFDGDWELGSAGGHGISL